MYDDDFDPYYKWLGIQSDEQPPDHYRLLGIERFELNADVIINAAERQADQLKRYLSGDDGKTAAWLLEAVSKARNCLLGIDSHRHYAAQLMGVDSESRDPTSQKRWHAFVEEFDRSWHIAQFAGFDPQHHWLGIPKNQQPASNYRLLGLSQGERNADVIRSAAEKQIAFVRKFTLATDSEVANDLLRQLSQARAAMLQAADSNSNNHQLKLDSSTAEQQTPVSENPHDAESLPAQPLGDSGPTRPLAKSFLPIRRGNARRRRKPIVRFVFDVASIGFGGITALVLATVILWYGFASDPLGLVQYIAGLKPIATLETQEKQDGTIRQSITKSDPLAKTEQGSSTPQSDEIPKQDSKTPQTSRDGESEKPQGPSVTTSKEMSTASTDVPPTNLQVQPSRAPVPDANSLVAAIAEVQRNFGDKLSAASSPRALSEVASELLDQSKNSAFDPVVRYALLQVGLETSVDAKLYDLIEDILQEMVEQFDLDKAAAKFPWLVKLSDAAETKSDHANVTEIALEVSTLLIRKGDYAQALDVAQRADDLAAQAQVRDLFVKTRLWLNRVKEIESGWQSVRSSIETLEANPNDEAASRAYGEFLFRHADLEQGLQHLVKGDEPTLMLAAKLDLSRPTDGLEQLKVADAWREIGKSQKDGTAFSARALYWYRQVLGFQQIGDLAPVEQNITALESNKAVTEFADTRFGSDAEPLTPDSILLSAYGLTSNSLHQTDEMRTRDGYLPRDAVPADKTLPPKASRPGPESMKVSSRPGATPKSITNSIGMKLNLIPAGSFMMGSPTSEPERNDDETQHRVTISKPFYIGTTEVTQGQWQLVTGTTPWKGTYREKVGPNVAANCVSWDDAMEFCNTLSAKEGRTYSLPTEAQWEFACRGGTTTKYSFGAEDSRLSDYGWWSGSFSLISGKRTSERYVHEVGLKRPNRFDLYDMHGNVSEFCMDWKADYPTESVTDPQGPLTGSNRVERGGSYQHKSKACRSAARSSATNSSQFLSGFRVVLSP